MHLKLIPVNYMQGILLQVRYFERKLSKSLKKDNFIFLLNLMSSACHSNVIRMSCHSYVIRMYSYITPMSLVCTRMPFVCHSYIIRTSPVCHLYVLVCYPYVTRMYSYVIRMSLVCGFTMNLLSAFLKLSYRGNHRKCSI